MKLSIAKIRRSTLVSTMDPNVLSKDSTLIDNKASDLMKLEFVRK